MPSKATPITVIPMPSFANQFAPRASSMAEADFLRCSRVDFGAGPLKGESGEGVETRAYAAGGTDAGGGGIAGV